MHDKIQCPNCSHNFDVEDAIAGQVEAKLQKEFQQKLATQTKVMQERMEQLDKDKQAFQQLKDKENELFKAKLDEKVKKEMAKLEHEKLESLSLELKAANEEIGKRKLETRALKEKEISLLRQKKELEEREEEMKLNVEKQVLEKSAQFEQQGRQKEKEAFELKEREYKKQLEDQKKLMEEMQRKHEQGSMQLQGEVQELAIEDWLRSEFPMDAITEVKKGARGADCIQLIKTLTNHDCGTIYYESKRTKEFQKSWIEKFKNDIRVKGANIGVLVTDVLPKGRERMGLVEGIWVCTFEEFKGLCFVLRENMIGISNAIASQENKGEKMAMLYSFLTSNEFKLQIEGIVEGFTQMQADLIKEKRSIEGHWKKREKQLQKVLLNTNYMYNSFKGIAGNAIQSISELEMTEEVDLLDEKINSANEVYDVDANDLDKSKSLFE